jgi:hypothetical protein
VATKEDAKTYVQTYVERRNRIVHEADLYKTRRNRHKARSISRPYAEDCVERVRAFVGALDAVIDEDLRRQFST